jgi:GTP-binding protein EngB required for normal cell division
MQPPSNRVILMPLPIPIIAAIAALVTTAAAGVAGYLWGKDLWTWLTGTPPPKDALEKARVLVAGPTGVGKTTLIRTVVGADLGKVGEGRPQTPGIEWLGTTDFPVWFADSKGLEIVKGEAQVEDVQSKLDAWSADERPHCAWLCIQADSARILGQADESDEAKRLRGTEGELGRVLSRANIPVIVVITQADLDGSELAAMQARCRDVFAFPHTVVPLCAEPRTGNGRILIPAHGLDTLRRLTIATLPAPLAKKTEGDWPT